MKGVLSRFKNLVMAATLVLSLGLHWPLLQSVAWFNMIVSFSQHEGIEQAVAKTFSGKHPCNLCKFVSEGKQAQDKKAPSDSIKKLDLILAATSAVSTSRDFTTVVHALLSEIALSRSSAPISPPPDLA